MMLAKVLRSSKILNTSLPKRAFGAMDIINYDLFEHKFTNEMEFKSANEKFKCFRVMDEDGNIINTKYDNTISDDELKKMFKAMV